MELFLIRHAHAEDLEPDEARPISATGREQIEALAKFLARSGEFKPDVLWHSPLVRARETAELLGAALKLTVPRVEKSLLRPDDDPHAFVRTLKSAKGSVAVIGHEPHLSSLASLLVVGASLPPAFVMHKAAALALEGAGVRWTVRWHVSPHLFG